MGRRSTPHWLCSLINFGKTPSALRKPEANGLLKGREIVRRDYPDHDHPKLREHVADRPANTAATAVRKSPARSGAVSRMSFVS